MVTSLISTQPKVRGGDRDEERDEQEPVNPQMTTIGRIMSCSSCSRMWQCHTYSAPPVRGLDGTRNGVDGKSNRMTTVVTSPGCILTVSFHPSSVGSGLRAGPV